jgi:hypothetical protein
LAFNQLLDFIDNLDTSIKHMVMFYEEPEYAKLVQMRFLSDGLKRGECCVYVPKDNDDQILTKTELIQSGVDVDSYMKKGLFQFYTHKPPINDKESYSRATGMFQDETKAIFRGSPDHPTEKLPKIRGVGSMFRDVFANKENMNSRGAEAAATELLMERLFQYDGVVSFDGLWMCAYQVDNIHASLNETWMAQLMESHDAVLFLPKLSNGIALDLRK